MRYIVFGIMKRARQSLPKHHFSAAQSVSQKDACSFLHSLMDGWFQSPPGDFSKAIDLDTIRSMPNYYFKDPIKFLEPMNLEHLDIVHAISNVFADYLDTALDSNTQYQPVLAHIYRTAEEAVSLNYLDLFENLGCMMVNWAHFENREDVREYILTAAEDLLVRCDKSHSAHHAAEHVRDYAALHLDRPYCPSSHKISGDSRKFHL